MYTLAVCAEMVFRDLPVHERARRIHDAGFQVEIWDWSRHDLTALERTGAVFSSMTGYLRGGLTDEDGAAELLRTAEESIEVAERLGCPRLNLHGTGLDGHGLPVVPVAGAATGPMWMAAHRTLTRLAELGERAGVTFTLENLNTAVDHPGVPFATAADTLLDTAVVTIRFDNGALATAEANFQAVYGYDVRGEVFGSAGMLTMGDIRRSHLTAYGPEASPPIASPTTRISSTTPTWPSSPTSPSVCAPDAPRPSRDRTPAPPCPSRSRPSSR
ncbi:hypothetical protein SMALB_1054 [Streptomyces malaysiensis]|uniref:Xylose isomerase-like TIM barrel domain-containing protein n=1 Tax=Streptomyces malaysiensis TaxID=92644 RepID=A0A7X6AVG4_STRMQ|nr:hypothetical protein [Streptomyces malaysiensis]